MAIVRTLGLFSAIGVLAGFIAAFVGCAVALSYDAVLPNRPSESWVERVVEEIVGLGLRRWRPVVAGTTLVLILAAGGVAYIEADTNPVGYLFPDHPVRQDSNLIERTMGPYAPLEFIVQVNSSASKPSLLQAVGQWQERAVTSGLVGWHYSPVDELRRLHAALPGGADTVPQEPDRLHDLIRLGSRDLPYLTDLKAHPDQLRVTFGVPIKSANGIRSTIDSLQSMASLPANATLKATGYLPLYVRMMALLTDSLASSFGLALLVILGMIGLLFRSGQVALLSLFPNGFPVLIALGLMGWMAIPLDVATMTIAAVVFGLVVDDTIHLLHRYATVRDGRGPVVAIRTAAHATGRRMVITTTVLAGGFLVLCLAQIKSIVWLGLLSAVAIVAALLADILVLPAAMAGLFGVDDS